MRSSVITVQYQASCLSREYCVRSDGAEGLGEGKRFHGIAVDGNDTVGMDCSVMVDGVHNGSYAAHCDSPPAFNKHIKLTNVTPTKCGVGFLGYAWTVGAFDR
jgi:hypothetical protein